MIMIIIIMQSFDVRALPLSLAFFSSSCLCSITVDMLSATISALGFILVSIICANVSTDNPFLAPSRTSSIVGLKPCS